MRQNSALRCLDHLWIYIHIYIWICSQAQFPVQPCFSAFAEHVGPRRVLPIQDVSSHTLHQARLSL